MLSTDFSKHLEIDFKIILVLELQLIQLKIYMFGKILNYLTGLQYVYIS